MPGELCFDIDASLAGARIDRLLAERFPDITRSRFQKLLRDGFVTARGRRVRSAYRVLLGDDIRVRIPPPEPLGLEPADIPLHIVYEDEDLLVVNKPPGLVVHPAAGNANGTLVNALLFHRPGLAGGDILRPGIVHRLDKDTSGLLVVAKNVSAHAVLSAALQERRVRRVYRALVWGAPADDEGTVDSAVGRSASDRKRMAVRRSGGKPALTRFHVLERQVFTSMLAVELGTGRTHQIRVHMASIGSPVFGDPTYDGRNSRLTRLQAGLRVWARKALDHMPRQALHAAELSFQHPVSGRQLDFAVELPEDFAETLAILRAPPSGVRT